MKKYIPFSILASPFLFSCATQKEDQRPNIIWIYADDHDQRAISGYGGSLIQTPNIDRIAHEGMIFHNSFVSNSISAPSRAVILTGKHSHKNGVIDNGIHFDGNQQTFPKLLQQAGYQTALIGKWHLHTWPTGFNYWNMLPGHGQYINPNFIENGDTIQTKGYITDITTDLAIEYLKNKREKGKPFMLMLQNKAPHAQFLPAFRHMSMFKNDTIPLPSTFFYDCKKRGTAACNNSLGMHDYYQSKDNAKMYDKSGDSIIGSKWMQWMYSMLSKEEQSIVDDTYLEENRTFLKNKEKMSDKEKALWSYQRYIKDYLRCVKAIDENVGRLLDYLDESGLSKNTIVMYSSDQGFYLGDFGWMDKRMMYEISMRTPLIARWPGVIQAKSTCDAMVQNIDMAETFLDIAGTSIPEDMQGISLLPLITGSKKNLERDALYYHYFGGGKVPAHFGIRTNTHKLIYFYQLKEWELYDLENDPQELTNIVSLPQNQALIIQLKEKLKMLQKEYNDTIHY